MTSEQRAWLEKHPTYSPLGVPGGMIVYMKTGLLHPSGKFELGRTVLKPGDSMFAFPVGIREVRQPGQLVDPRGNPNTRGYDQK